MLLSERNLTETLNQQGKWNQLQRCSFQISRSKSNLLSMIMQRMEGQARALETCLLEAILFEEKIVR